MLLSTGCQTTPSPAPADLTQLSLFESYRVDRIELDYIARCKIQIKNEVINQSSSCDIAISALGEMKLTLHHLLAGEILVIFMDDQKIQIMNRDEKIFYDLRNTEKNRSRFPEIPNFTVPELFEIMWGRRIKTLETQLVYNYDTQGRPLEVFKKDQKNDLLVSYKRWKKSKGINIPGLLVVNDKRNKTRIKLVITEFTPGRAGNLKFTYIPDDYIIKH